MPYPSPTLLPIESLLPGVAVDDSTFTYSLDDDDDFTYTLDD